MSSTSAHRSRPRGARSAFTTAAAVAALVAGLVLPGSPAGARGKASSTDPIVITTASPLPDAHVGFAYSVALKATGGNGSYTWSICTGWSAPDGMSLSSGGVLSGSPDPSLFATTFILCVSVSSGGTTSVGLLELEIDIEDGDGPNPVVTTDELAGAKSGTPYQAVLGASGGDGSPYFWQSCPGWSMPDGLALSPAGVISGTPLESVSKTTQGICVRVISGGASSRLLALRIDVPGSGVPPEIITDSLSDAVAGQPYSATLQVAGGEGPPYEWELCEGWAPPEGMTLSAGGVLSGTASWTQGGATVNVCVTVESGGGRSGASRILPLFVQEAPSAWTVSLMWRKVSPAALNVAQGDSLRFTNTTKKFTRVITSPNGRRVYARLAPGQSFTLKLGRVKTYSFTEQVTGSDITVKVMAGVG